MKYKILCAAHILQSADITSNYYHPDRLISRQWIEILVYNNVLEKFNYGHFILLDNVVHTYWTFPVNSQYMKMLGKK